MPARLVPLDPGLSRPLDLQRPVLLIGRLGECDAQILHPRVSRRHCCVAQVADRLVIRDLGSRTGVRINGYLVDEAALADGDEVAIGPVVFRLEVDALDPDDAGRGLGDGSEASGADDSDLIPLDDD